MARKSRIFHTQQTYGLRKKAQEFPIMCVLSLVYICNAKCPNYPYNNSEIREKCKNSRIMPADIFKIIAD